MFFVKRNFVCDRLKMSAWASYKILPANYVHMINSDSVIKVLNDSRRGNEIEINYIPSDIVTAEELEKSIGIPSRKILTWTRRSRNTIPHYRINKQTTRFRRSSVENWLALKG